MGPRAGSYGCRKSLPHRNSIPGPSSPQRSRYTDYATLSTPPTTAKLKNELRYSSTPPPLHGVNRKKVTFYFLLFDVEYIYGFIMLGGL